MCGVGLLGHDWLWQQTNQRPWQPPVHLPENLHESGHQDHPHYRGVNQDGHRESQAELLV